MAKYLGQKGNIYVLDEPTTGLHIPKGFDIIALPAAEYLAVQGEPFQGEDYSQAILAVQYAINHYDPSVIGCEWDEDSPCIQLEPRGERGYIELWAIRKQQT